MERHDEPWLDASGLRLHVEAQIYVVEMIASDDRNETLDPDILRNIFPIIAACQQRYGRMILLDTVLTDMLLGQPGNGPKAIVMLSSLKSLCASLVRIERDETRRNIFDSASEERLPRGRAAQHFAHPPDETENRLGDDGYREYRTGFTSQHRRAAANRSRLRPW